MPPRQVPFVSVIIPVYNDATRLHACLACLMVQTYPSNRIQIIVVDNGSTNGAESLVEFKNVCFIQELIPGSYAARNAGIAAASGTILAFTDSDCCPEPDWIEAGVNALCRDRSVGFIAGNVSLFFRLREPTGPVELFESTIGCPFPQKLFVKNEHFGVTANLFSWSSTFRDVGVFDANLKSAGDLEWGQRATSKGYKGEYGSEVTVRHPSRHTWTQLVTRAARIAGGEFDLAKTRCALSTRWVLRECFYGLGLAADPMWRFEEDEPYVGTLLQILYRLPLSAIPYVWTHHTLAGLTVWQRLQVIAGFVGFHYSRGCELIRLWSGGISRRL